jgi:anaerobic ribonucleoside-triphosphate reductase activating protein
MMIRTDDMLNGDGLRVVLFCTACDHYCKNCHNQETWQASNGMLFDDNAKLKIFEELEKDYINGLTLSGGDPLNKNNLNDIFALCKEVKNKYPNKTIWIYSGYEWFDIFYEQGYVYPQIDVGGVSYKYTDTDRLMRQKIISLCDVFVGGKFIEELADVKYPWAGSTNQNVIDVKKSFAENKVVLWSE